MTVICLNVICNLTIILFCVNIYFKEQKKTAVVLFPVQP